MEPEAGAIHPIRLNAVKPYTYLAATITKTVNGHSNARLDELLPWAYPAANAQRRGLRTTLTPIAF
jgi:hypothetical protein